MIAMKRSAASIRAEEASWPQELVVCKRILEVMACGKAMQWRHGYGVHPVLKYPCGAITAQFDSSRGVIQAEVTYFHTLATDGSGQVAGVTFAAKMRGNVGRVSTAITFEDLANDEERKRFIEFMGNRMLHSMNNPEDYHLTGASDG